MSKFFIRTIALLIILGLLKDSSSEFTYFACHQGQTGYQNKALNPLECETLSPRVALAFKLPARTRHLVLDQEAIAARRQAGRVSLDRLSQSTRIHFKIIMKLEKGNTSLRTPQQVRSIHKALDSLIPQTLRERRDAARIFNDQLGHVLNISPTAVSNALRGLYRASPPYLTVFHQAIDFLQSTVLREHREAARLDWTELSTASNLAESDIADAENPLHQTPPDVILRLHAAIDAEAGPMIRRRREAARITTDELADQLKTGRGNIWRYEENQTPLDTQGLLNVQEALDILQRKKVNARRQSLHLSFLKLSSLVEIPRRKLQAFEEGLHVFELAVVETLHRTMAAIDRQLDMAQRQRFQDRRIAARLSARIVAEEAGYSKHHLDLYEEGVGSYPIQTITIFHQAFNRLAGIYLRTRRETAGLSQKVVSGRAGMSLSRYQYLETAPEEESAEEWRQAHQAIDVLQAAELKIRRIAARIKRSALARALGHSEDYLMDLETNRLSFVRPQTWQRIFSVLNHLQGTLLKRRRVSSRLSIKKLAGLARMRRETLVDLETGRMVWPAHKIRVLYGVLDANQGTQITLRREAVELSPPQLHQMTGISENYLYRIETNRVIPTPDILEKIHTAIDEAVKALKGKGFGPLWDAFEFQDWDSPKVKASNEHRLSPEEIFLLRDAIEEEDQQMQRIKTLLPQVSDNQERKVLELSLAGMALDEIAIRLGIDAPTADRLWIRGIETVKKLLMSHASPQTQDIRESHAA